MTHFSKLTFFLFPCLKSARNFCHFLRNENWQWMTKCLRKIINHVRCVINTDFNRLTIQLNLSIPLLCKSNKSKMFGFLKVFLILFSLGRFWLQIAICCDEKVSHYRKLFGWLSRNFDWRQFQVFYVISNVTCIWAKFLISNHSKLQIWPS
jgi:hypothetical protein